MRAQPITLSEPTYASFFDFSSLFSLFSDIVTIAVIVVAALVIIRVLHKRKRKDDDGQSFFNKEDKWN